MALNLTQKEQMLLQDQKSHEEICIQKYKNYAEQAQDPQLKQMFNSFAEQEQQHWKTLDQILSGQMPDFSQQSQGQGQQKNQGATAEVKQQMKNVMNNQKDAALCTDMLMTEKYVSSTYDTAIFESTDPNIRQLLNHIQKEEQQHGEGLFNYMKNAGMYNPK